MIIARDPLNQFVPLENASMPGRVVAQWDKDDCEDLGIIKIDLLGLGMMAALQETVTLCTQRGRPVDLAQLPENDPATFELMQRADTIGVFQIESRAQMATLPRMRPERFYDLVIEIAIIRPGPIEGGLAHPYLARRNGEEPVTYFGDDDRLKPILGRTLGVPLFQEQMLAARRPRSCVVPSASIARTRRCAERLPSSGRPWIAPGSIRWWQSRSWTPLDPLPCMDSPSPMRSASPISPTPVPISRPIGPRNSTVPC
jgi:hypothetical protein